MPKDFAAFCCLLERGSVMHGMTLGGSALSGNLLGAPPLECLRRCTSALERRQEMHSCSDALSAARKKPSNRNFSKVLVFRCVFVLLSHGRVVGVSGQLLGRTKRAEGHAMQWVFAPCVLVTGDTRD